MDIDENLNPTILSSFGDDHPQQENEVASNRFQDFRIEKYIKIQGNFTKVTISQETSTLYPDLNSI